MQHSSWQKELQQVDKDPQALLEKLQLQRLETQLSTPSQQSFPLRSPQSYTARMRAGDSHDPLLRQILPVFEEDTSVNGFTPDPLSEADFQPVPGVLHKYHGRALLIVTGACAIHCRYCFRRHFPYNDANPARDDWEQSLTYIENEQSLQEIILSGGDPLTLSNAKLAQLIQRLAAIQHLKRLRIHTRIPVVLPERIDSELLDILNMTRLKPVMVVHANHAREIDEKVKSAIKLMRERTIPIFNQSVLLRGINDTTKALMALSNRLFDCGIIPYYLHMLDPVQGAAHFEVSEDIALKLMSNLRKKLPGYLIPKLVREQAGQPYKTPVEAMTI